MGRTMRLSRDTHVMDELFAEALIDPREFIPPLPLFVRSPRHAMYAVLEPPRTIEYRSDKYDCIVIVERVDAVYVRPRSRLWRVGIEWERQHGEYDA